MKPFDLKLIRWTLALIWLVTGALSFGLYPVENSLKLLRALGLSGSFAQVTLYSAATLDVVLGLLTLLKPSRWLWRIQLILVLGYSAIIAWYLPYFYLHPFGPVLKNLPILLLLWFLHQYDGKRKK